MIEMNTDFTLATEHVQLMTEQAIIPQKRDQSYTSLFQQDLKGNSPLHNLKNYCFTSKSSEKNQNGTNSNITSDHPRSSVQEENFLNSAQEEQLNAFEHRLFNPGNEFTAIDNIISEQHHNNNQATNSILQIKIDHASDIFEFFEKEPSYNSIEIIDYERFLTVAEFAFIDEKLRGLSKKFKALRITNVDLTSQHLKILEFGLLSKRKDLEIQLNNTNIDDQSFFQFLLESRCYKIIQFINNIGKYFLKQSIFFVSIPQQNANITILQMIQRNYKKQLLNQLKSQYIFKIKKIGILKFIEQIYYKHQTQAGRPRNMVRINQYSVVLEKSDDDLVFSLHTGQNQFYYLSSSEDQLSKYPIINYDLKACSRQMIQDILSCKFARINLPQILFLAIKIEAWNVLEASDAIEQIRTINTLDLGGSKDLSDQNIARVFLKDKIFRIKDLILRNIPFTNPSFKLFVQHFLYSDFTTLKALDISDCELNDEKIFLLCENIRLRKEKITLEQLFLQKNPLIGEEGWRRLFSLMVFGQCSNITDLDIRGCLITSKHLREGIIPGMRTSHRFIRKFCIRFPLRRFFISTSEMTNESWKILLTEFLFYAKMGLTHYNFFFTGFFMQNNILNNESLLIKTSYPEIKASDNINTPTRFSSPRFDLHQINSKSNPSFYPNNQVGSSMVSSPNSIAHQGKDTSMNVIQQSNKNLGIAPFSNQYRGASQSSASSESATHSIQTGKKKNSVSPPEQPINQIYDSSYFNTIVYNPIDDSVISHDVNNSNMNFSVNNSTVQNPSNNSYIITSPNLNQKSPSQTQIAQTKSLFSKESVLKQHQRKSGTGQSTNSKVQFLQQDIVSIPSFNLKQSTSKEGLTSPVAYKNSTVLTQLQKSGYQIPQSPGARSLESFNSIKSTTKEKGFEKEADKSKEADNNKQEFEKNKRKQSENEKENKEEGIVRQTNSESDNSSNYPKLKRTFQQLSSKQITDQTLEGESAIKNRESRNFLKSSREWTISALNSAEIDVSKIETIGGIGSNSSQPQQQSLSEAIKAKKKNSVNQQIQIPYSSHPIKKSTSLKNFNNIQQNTESDSQQKRKQWQKLNSYSHKRSQMEKQGNKKFMRSITHNSSSSVYKNLDENSKQQKSPGQNNNNGSNQEKNASYKSFLKKSSFGYKHVKSTQEIMDNINQVVYTESIKTIPKINGSPELLVNSKNMKEYASPLSQNGQSSLKEHALSTLKQMTNFNTADNLYIKQKNNDFIEEKEKISDRQESCERSGTQQVSFNFYDEYLDNSDNILSSKQSNKRVHSLEKGQRNQSPILQSSPVPQSHQNAVSEKTISEPVFVQATSIHFGNNLQYNESGTLKKLSVPNKEEGLDISPLALDSKEKVPPIVFPPSLSDADEPKQNERDKKSEKSKKINFEEPNVVSNEKGKGFEQKLSQKQTLAVEKVKKNQFLKKNYRKKNVAGLIHKEEVIGTSESAIFNIFQGFLKMKRNFLQQIIFHNNETFPYLTIENPQSSIPEFQGKQLKIIDFNQVIKNKK